MECSRKFLITCLIGNVRARVDPTTAQSRDHLVQQLPPVNTWGQEFVTVPIPRDMDRGDIFTMTASEANTNVAVTIIGSDGASRQQTITLNNPGGLIFDTLLQMLLLVSQSSRIAFLSYRLSLGIPECGIR